MPSMVMETIWRELQADGRPFWFRIRMESIFTDARYWGWLPAPGCRPASPVSIG